MSGLLTPWAFSVMFLAVTTGCGGTASIDTTQPEALPQGITGTVTKSVGDFMCCPRTGKSYPVSVPVYIVRGHVARDDQSSPLLEALDVVAAVHSDSGGRFGAGLVPGTYTTFAEFDGALYLNCYEGGSEMYCSRDVLPGQFVEFDIDNNSEATY